MRAFDVAEKVKRQPSCHVRRRKPTTGATAMTWPNICLVNPTVRLVIRPAPTVLVACGKEDGGKACASTLPLKVRMSTEYPVIYTIRKAPGQLSLAHHPLMANLRGFFNRGGWPIRLQGPRRAFNSLPPTDGDIRCEGLAVPCSWRLSHCSLGTARNLPGFVPVACRGSQFKSDSEQLSQGVRKQARLRRIPRGITKVHLKGSNYNCNDKSLTRND